MALLAAIGERDAILRALSENHRDYLTVLRSFAREHALRHGKVSIDDVRDAIEREGFPMPKDIGADERVFAGVFTRKEFEAIGVRKTRRADFAARVGVSRSMVTVYRLKERKAA